MSEPHMLLMHVESQASSRRPFWFSTYRLNFCFLECLHFSCLFGVFSTGTSPHFWGKLCLLLQNKNFSKFNKFVFSCQMSLRIIAVLVKNPLCP